MEYEEHWVPRGRHLIYLGEYGGEDPAVELMHGFPDNLHLYDRLTPHLSGRRVMVFDFLGWGSSDKPAGYPYTAETTRAGTLMPSLGTWSSRTSCSWPTTHRDRPRSTGPCGTRSAPRR
jgi:pimeloyl-ACP methyl ester carboxylesterase